jgi:hypothetical protein
MILSRRGALHRQAQARFRRALRERDVPALIEASRILFKPEQQPSDHAQAEAMMHWARAGADWLELEHRSFSHFWLLDKGVPSPLPPCLEPEARRYRPEIKSSVGVAYGTGKEWLKPAAPLIHGAMLKAVVDHAELIETDPDQLRDEIQFARRDEFQRLFGVFDAKEVER